VLESRSLMETALTGQGQRPEEDKALLVFETEEERRAADFALRLISERYERELKKGISQLAEPDVQERITREVEQALMPVQGKLDLGQKNVNVAKVVATVTAKVTELTIEIPDIVVIPTQASVLKSLPFRLPPAATFWCSFRPFRVAIS